MISTNKKSLAALFLMIAVTIPGTTAFGSGHPELKAFPSAGEGVERFVIVLPHKEREEEGAFSIELIAGKEMLTDGVNQVRLTNTIEQRTLEGWGYSYYEVIGKSDTITTLMAPPEGAPLVKSFVTAAPLHVRYNSRLPIVVYVPKGYEVRYRIWRANKKFQEATIQ